MWDDDCDPEFTFGDFADFERVAVTPAQVKRWKLPTRPTKKSDSRAGSFTGDSVELDAIPPHRLRSLARQAIERHVDQRQLGVLRTYEAQERKVLERMAATVNGEGGR